jgi:hypothetical protein
MHRRSVHIGVNQHDRMRQVHGQSQGEIHRRQSFAFVRGGAGYPEHIPLFLAKLLHDLGTQPLVGIDEGPFSMPGNQPVILHQLFGERNRSSRRVNERRRLSHRVVLWSVRTRTG